MTTGTTHGTTAPTQPGQPADATISRPSESLVGTVGARLAPLLAQADAVLVVAPPELAAAASLEAAVRRVDNAAPRRLETGPGAQGEHALPDLAALASALRDAHGPSRVLLHWRAAPEEGAPHDAAERGPGPAAVLDAVVRLLHDGDCPPVLLVLDADERTFLDQDAFDLVLSAASLVLSPEEVAVVVGDSLSPVGLRTMHEVTGGVPALVSAGLEDLADGRCRDLVALGSAGTGLLATTPPTRVEAVARTWARRLVRARGRDPLGALLSLLAPMAVEPSAAIASHVLGRDVGPAEVRHLLAGRAEVLPVEGARPSPPPLLARFLVLELLEQDRSTARGARRRVLAAVCDPSVPVRTLDRVLALTILGDWDRLNTLLSGSLAVLALLTRTERIALLRRWPGSGLTMWPWLAAGRAFLDGSWRRGAGTGPRPWEELSYLVGATDPVRLPAGVGSLHVRVRRLTGGGPVVDGPAARQGLEEILSLVHERISSVRREHDQGDLSDQAHEEHLALLCLALQGAAEACLGAGMVVRALECLNEARVLARLVPDDVLGSHRTEQGLRARLALLAAVADLPDEAGRYLAAYDADRTDPDLVDDDERALVRVARLLLEAGTGAGAPTSPDGTVPHQLDTSYAPVLPLHVVAVGRALLVTHNAETVAHWFHDRLGKARWAGLPDWQWWPVHLAVALLDARAARLDAVDSWLALGSIPASGAQVVRASAALAVGAELEAREIAGAVLASPTATARWRLHVEGLLLGADAGVTRADTVRLRSSAWVRSRDQIALLPDAARVAVSRTLGLETEPATAPAPPGRSRDQGARTRLTARQSEILDGLQRGLTVPEIAAELGVGTETVRTLTKRLYRRLGVHSRTDAARVARELGLTRAR